MKKQTLLRETFAKQYELREIALMPSKKEEAHTRLE